MPYNTEKAIKFDNKVFKDVYFFNFLAVNAPKMCSKCLVHKWWIGNKPIEFGKIVLKI